MLIVDEPRSAFRRDVVLGAPARQRAHGGEPRQLGLDAILQLGMLRSRLIKAANADADVGTFEEIVGKRRPAIAAELALDQARRPKGTGCSPRPVQVLL